MYSKEELINKLNYKSKENDLYIPNEIFDDLKKVEYKKHTHVSFAYSYYYLVSWLYRYGKYGEVVLKAEDIKEILGYRKTNKDIVSVMKHNGLLDQLGYTYSSTDFPYAWEFNNGDIEFHMFSELDNETKKYMRKSRGKNYKVKVPVKGLWRDADSKQEEYYNGTFYDIGNTHHMPFDIFIDCMSNDDLECSGFFLYGFLKDRIQRHRGKYKKSYKGISELLGMCETKVKNLVKELSEQKMIKVTEGDCKHVEGECEKDAHTYEIIR